MTTLQYDQPSVLVQHISRYIKRFNAASLLDIGAGFATTAVPLSRSVRRYVGVEENQERAIALRAAGLDIIIGEFPLPVDAKFDMVLTSHSVPEKGLEYYEPFFDSARAMIKLEGLLLVVTFKGSKGEIAVLREEITGRTVGLDPQLTAILNNMRMWGRPQVEKVNSHLRSPSADDIAEWLAPCLFRTAAEKDQHSSRLMEILETRYRVKDRIVFPTEHLFISARSKA
jgi:hypothetical protein